MSGSRGLQGPLQTARERYSHSAFIIVPFRHTCLTATDVTNVTLLPAASRENQRGPHRDKRVTQCGWHRARVGALNASIAVQKWQQADEQNNDDTQRGWQRTLNNPIPL